MLHLFFISLGCFFSGSCEAAAFVPLARQTLTTYPGEQLPLRSTHRRICSNVLMAKDADTLTPRFRLADPSAGTEESSPAPPQQQTAPGDMSPLRARMVGAVREQKERLGLKYESRKKDMIDEGLLPIDFDDERDRMGITRQELRERERDNATDLTKPLRDWDRNELAADERLELLQGINPVEPLFASVVAAVVAYGGFSFMGQLLEIFRASPIPADAAYPVQRLGGAFQQMLFGVVSLGTFSVAINAVGLLVLAMRVAYGIWRGELDPNKRDPTLPSYFDIQGWIDYTDRQRQQLKEQREGDRTVGEGQGDKGQEKRQPFVYKSALVTLFQEAFDKARSDTAAQQSTSVSHQHPPRPSVAASEQHGHAPPSSRQGRQELDTFLDSIIDESVGERGRGDSADRGREKQRGETRGAERKGTTRGEESEIDFSRFAPLSTK
ncbi:unnamed protein product [Vitrella brassicaformis CCMP3155]|uniref:Uncharacterized protein n=1 Tax=Vitrella brassicaformis (strain CCMP3155) TaxID=1169540 RepID=A0A0G4F262_VITBC|nr:unnamed protein product [Vitrella brassicaformis CCMP3155]|eukprot:CEM05619.1 unnamed protein product [Vitrella brassicaformis CCMP3155]